MTTTFNFNPLIAWQKTNNHNVLITTFESGLEQRRYKGARPTLWVLEFRDTTTVIESIVAFFNARKGPYEAFSWTPPGASTPILVRFEEASLNVTNYGSYYSECELTLREVL